MRNLKRVLSLALALVMVLGMMVITTNAAYTDAADIEYKEAVAVVSAIGVMNGVSDTEFAPKAELTRAQAATILARVKLGNLYNTLDDQKAQKVFNDVAVGEWYAAEVAYCYNAKLIAGVGNGNFDPNGKLTGLAFAKLLLVAMGYDPAAQGYLGDEWKNNITADAVTAHLVIPGVELDNVLTREQAAQMLLQAMNEETVKYTTAYDYATGAAVVIGPNPAEKTFRELYFSKLGFTDEDGTDAWGNPWDYKWTYNGKPVWTTWYAPVAEYFTAVDECDIVEELGEDEAVEYTAYVDGNENKTTGEWDDKDNSTVNYSVTGTGVWTRIYDTDKGYVAVAINTYFGQITWVNYEKADKNGHVYQEAGYEVRVYDEDNSWKKNIVTDEEFEKYDYVLVNVCNGEIAAIELAEYETETLKRISYAKGAANKEHVRDVVTAKDGDVYGENVKFFNIYNAGTKKTEDALKTKTVEYNLYLDGQGNIIAAIIPAPEKDTIKYGVITRINWVDTNDDDIDGYAKFTMTGMDAEPESGLKLTDYLGEDLQYADKQDEKTPESLSVSTNRQDNKAWHDNLYQYTLNKKAGTYEVTAVADTYEVYELTADTRFEVEVDGEFYRANNATQFLIKVGNNSYETYTGWKNVPELLAKEGEVIEAQYFLKGNYVSMVFIDATDVIWAGESVIVYIGDTEMVAEDDTLYAFNAFVGTEEEEFILAEGVEVEDEGLFILSFNADNQVIAITPVSKEIWVELKVDGAEGGVLEVLENEFDDFDIDEVPFYYVTYGVVKESDPSYVEEGDTVYALNLGGKLIAVYTGYVAY